MADSIYGFRVRQARTLRGRASGDLAKVLGWSASKLTRVEAADSLQIGGEELRALSDNLQYPTDFFLHPGTDLNYGDLLFRAPKSTPKREQQFLADYAAVTGDFLAWLDSLHRLPNVRLPQPLDMVGVGESSVSFAQIKTLAQDCRAAMNLSKGMPAPYLTHELERLGVVVIVRSRGLQRSDPDVWDKDAISLENHVGYSTWVGDHRDRPVIILRSLDSWERTRWTLAHELGHLVLHRNAPTLEKEQDASTFASEFLAPIDALEEELPRSITLTTLLPLKLKWGLSIYALLRHLLRGDLITNERYKSMTDQLHVRRNAETGRTWRRDEPGWDAREPERPAIIRTWCERCLGTTDSGALQMLSKRWPSDFLDELLATQRSSAKRSNHVRNLGPAVEAGVVDMFSRRKRSTG